jgi:hypothetical protein
VDGGRGGKVPCGAECVADFIEEVEVDGYAGDVSADGMISGGFVW